MAFSLLGSSPATLSNLGAGTLLGGTQLIFPATQNNLTASQQGIAGTSTGLQLNTSASTSITLEVGASPALTLNATGATIPNTLFLNSIALESNPTSTNVDWIQSASKTGPYYGIQYNSAYLFGSAGHTFLCSGTPVVNLSPTVATFLTPMAGTGGWNGLYLNYVANPAAGTEAWINMDNASPYGVWLYSGAYGVGGFYFCPTVNSLTVAMTLLASSLTLGTGVTLTLPAAGAINAATSIALEIGGTSGLSITSTLVTSLFSFQVNAGLIQITGSTTVTAANTQIVRDSSGNLNFNVATGAQFNLDVNGVAAVTIAAAAIVASSSTYLNLAGAGIQWTGAVVGVTAANFQITRQSAGLYLNVPTGFGVVQAINGVVAVTTTPSGFTSPNITLAVSQTNTTLLAAAANGAYILNDNNGGYAIFAVSAGTTVTIINSSAYYVTGTPSAGQIQLKMNGTALAYSSSTALPTSVTTVQTPRLF